MSDPKNQPPASANPEDPNAQASSSQDDTNAEQGGKGPAQSTRSYIFLESVGSSMMYEKDGDWVLGKTPRYIFAPKKTWAQKEQDRLNNIDDDQNEDESEEGGSGGSKRPERAMIMIDTLTCNEAIPCNLCDKVPNEYGNDMAPLWSWMYTMIGQIVGKVKEYKRSMEQKDVSVGESYRPPETNVDEALACHKGTQN